MFLASAQVVCITDPVLATQIMRSKHFDKIRFHYSFLDPVSFSRFVAKMEQQMILLHVHTLPAGLFPLSVDAVACSSWEAQIC